MFKLCNELFFSTAFNAPCICPKIRYDDYWQASHLFLFLNQEAGADCSVFERNKRPFKKQKKKREREEQTLPPVVQQARLSSSTGGDQIPYVSLFWIGFYWI